MAPTPLLVIEGYGDTGSHEGYGDTGDYEGYGSGDRCLSTTSCPSIKYNWTYIVLPYMEAHFLCESPKSFVHETEICKFAIMRKNDAFVAKIVNTRLT